MKGLHIVRGLLLVMLLSFSAASQVSAELLVNPGFENAFGSPPEWTVTVLSGTFGVSGRDTVSARTGSYGAHLQISGGAVGHAYLEQVVSGLTPGASYTASGWMRHVWDRTDKYHVYIEVLGGGPAQSSAYSTTTYTQYTLSQTADSGGQLRVRLHLDKYATTTSDKVCDAHFDDMSVLPVGGTVPEPPTGGSAVADSPGQITWGWTRAAGASGEIYRAYDAAAGGSLIWVSGSQASSYTESGLLANTLYGAGAATTNQRHLATFQVYESESRLALPGRYTLAKAPTYDDTLPYGDVTVRCDVGQTKTDCTPGQNITFTYNNAFGEGPANVGKLTYKWDTSSSWDGTGGTDWASGAVLVKQAGGDPSTYYLHLRSWNSDSPMVQNTTTLTLGPYSVGGGGPVLPAKAVKHHSGGVFDGQTWATAFDNIQDAINASLPGDEIWVAAGTYVENIVVPGGIALYGGFAGNETTRSQRNWLLNKTVIDGNGANSVVQISQNASASTRVDGFTITNGRAMCGGGVFINHSAAPVIVNNIITGNHADYEGGGIYCSLSCAAVIASNRILSNGAVTAGGGICTKTGTPAIVSNFIAGNSARAGGGICAGDTTTASAEPIRNNTIVANAAAFGGGINCRAMSSATISNNIVAYNSNGIFVESGTGAPVLKKNDVWANDGYNYSGISSGSTDISSDPLLASYVYGDFHIQPGSPCRNAGDDTQVISGYNDIDDQARVQGAAVDIGADESDGTTWAVTPAIIRVSTTGNDANDGSSWAQAKRTIQAAINAASASGEVWVKAGTYSENIVLRDHVYVYGGFAGSETSRSQRNWTSNVTIIDGQAANSAVTAVMMGYRVSAIDGFTLRNGSSWHGAGVFCSNASPIITNNIITANKALGGGGGIYLANSCALAKANQVTNNVSLCYGGGIHSHYSKAEISRNNIQSNSACTNGCGVFASSGDTSSIVNNRIVLNQRYGSIGDAWGSAVSVDSYAAPTMICNTVADNTSATGAIYAGVQGTLAMYSNIVAFNSSGIVKDTAATVTQVASYTADPSFVDRSGGNYRLQSGSPCIDAADAATAPFEDYDGNGRPVDGNGDGTAIADIGCYEFGTFVPEPPVPPTSAAATPSSICTGESSTLHANGGSGLILRWLVGGCDGTSIGTGNDLVVTPTQTTTYYCRWETSLGNSTCASTTVTITGEGPTASVGGPQSIPEFGTTEPLGGNTPTPPATGQWSVVSGGTGTFSDPSDPNATFTHTGGEGPIILRWTVSSPPCNPAHADVTVSLGYYCLHNGNFDGGFTDGVADGWIKQAPVSGTWSQETTIKHSGVASQKIVDATGGTTYTSFIYQTVQVQPGRVYTPTMWLYRVGGAVIRIGVDPNGGTTFTANDAIPTSNQWVYRTHYAFTAGSSGQMSLGLAVGYNSGSGTAYFDDVAIKPQSPQSVGGTATITAGNSATLTASGGFGGSSDELCWYTGPNGTGDLVGKGTVLIVWPTVTTTYYPRWETTGLCSISDDGASVTVTVLPPAQPPTVTSITPASGANTGTVSITDLAGTNFVSGAGVKLRRAGYTDINASSVVVSSPTKITCVLDLTGRKTGLWDVVVTNPDLQSASLANGFGITIGQSSGVVGASISSLMHSIAGAASAAYRFRVWGRVETIDSSTFWLNDGSGTRIRVFAPGYTGVSNGDFVSAVGSADVSVTPPVLVSGAGGIVKY